MISIIDDDPMMLEAMGELVRSLGYGASTFASAEDFLGLDCVNNTSCVISDVRMPGLSGVDLQSALTAQGNHTPIIFMTAWPDEGIRRRVLAAGAVGFLTKPFDDDCLTGYLDKAVQNGNRRSI